MGGDSTNSFCSVLGLHYFACGEDRRRHDIKNENLSFSFCSVLGLHYFACGEDRGAMT